MSRLIAGFAAFAALMFSALVSAQQPAPLPAGVPEKMPFDIPYGVAISMDMAKKAVEAAIAESAKRGWKMAVAVVSPSGDLIYFAKMDDTQLISSDIAPKKARTAAKFRRETKSSSVARKNGTASLPDPLDHTVRNSDAGRNW